MQAVVSQSELARALATVKGVLPRKATLPILQGIRVTTDPETGTVELAGTNLEVWTATRLNGAGTRATEAGAVVVDGRQLATVARQAKAQTPDGAVGLAINAAGRLELRAGPAVTTLDKLADLADFPGGLAVDAPLATATVDGATLAGMFGAVRHAVGTDPRRESLQAVYLELDPAAGKLTLTTADGFRLAHAEAELDPWQGEPATALVPPAALAMVDAKGGPVTVTLNADAVAFDQGPLHVAARQGAGQYPDYGRIIPQAIGHRLEVAVADLERVLQAAAPVARDSGNVVRFRPADQWMEVSARATTVGEFKTGLAAALTAYGKDAARDFALNCRYAVDALAVAPGRGARIRVDVLNPAAPLTFRPAADGGPWTALAVVMPMHVVE